MCISVAELQRTLHDLFTSTADDLARETGFCQRERVLNGSRFSQLLVFSWLDNPNATIDDLADNAYDLGFPLQPQAIHQRFTESAACFLQELLGEAFGRAFDRSCPRTLPLLRRFPGGVHVRDGSTVSLPASLANYLLGCGGGAPGAGPSAALKVVVSLEVTSGTLSGLSLLAGRDNEQTAEVAHAPLPPGALLLEDMGFFCLDRLRHYDSQGVYFLSNLPVRTVLFDEAGRRVDLVRLLRRQTSDRLDMRVRVGARDWLPCRLLAVRVSQEEEDRRCQRVRQEAADKGRPVSQKKLDLCGWDVLVTNAPVELLSAAEAVVVRRVRWQVELLFKVWKSEGRLDESRGRKPWRVLCELYAKLLGQVVQQWAMVAAGWRPLRHSGRKAARRVQRLALSLLETLGRPRLFARQIAKLRRRIYRRCAIKLRPPATDTCGWQLQPRADAPTTYDRLRQLDPSFKPKPLAA